jgi:hypothetical protein
MSDFKWCHGPDCHTYTTTDRVRGSKGSKVLRTRKVRQHTERSWYDPNNIYNYFCSQSCITNFWNTHAQRVIAIAPRPTPLETPIEDPEKVTHEYPYGSYTRTLIKKVDSDNNVG